MPLFPWIPLIQGFRMGWELGRRVMSEAERFTEDVQGETSGIPSTPDREELAALLAYRAERKETEEVKLERTRWLEEHRAERTFLCGVVPDPVLEATDPGQDTSEPPPEPRTPLLPSDPGWAAPDPPVTATGAPPPAPPEPQPLTPLRPMQVIAAVLPEDLVFIREQGSTEEVEEVGRLPRSAIEGVGVVDAHGAGVPEPVREEIEPSHPVFTVLRWSNDGAPDEDRFLFRSPWMAWQAAHRLREAKRAG